MARQRDPRREEAYQIWKDSNGSKKLKDIAEELDVSDTQIRKWKSQDKWEPSKGNVTNSKSNVTKPKAENIVTIEAEGLNDRQQLFCLYYLKYFNATKAYQKVYECAYSTAMVEGHRHLRNPKITAEIDRMKEEQTSEIKLSVKDILQKYIDIAFSDITDFVVFGRDEEIVYDENGRPKIDANGNVKKQTFSYVHLNESLEVDGTILTEVKEGRDGVSVKLADKMKALEMLSKYFDLLSDKDKQKLQEEKLKADIVKAQAEAENIKRDNDGSVGKDWVSALKDVADRRKQMRSGEANDH